MVKFALFAVVLTGLVLGSVGRAKAAQNEAACTVSVVAWNNNTLTSSKGLYVTCTSGNTYWAYVQGGGGSCTTLVDLDSVKMWLSAAQSAKLAGRPVSIWYNANIANCPTRMLTSIEF